MAKFQIVAKEIERLCKTYQDKCRTDECPLYYEDLCYALSMSHIHDYDAGRLEGVVMRWSEEHPEPVYPTWGEWFVEQSGFVKEWKNATNPAWEASIAIAMFRMPIRADIAEKLGIEPKEGT